MDLNNITKGKIIPLGIIIIIISYLTSGSNSSILPFILFVGILVGIIKHTDIKESAITALITSFIGSFISLVFTITLTYFSYGAMYATYLIQTSLIYLIYYVLIGTVGGAIGYYIYNEIEN